MRKFLAGLIAAGAMAVCASSAVRAELTICNYSPWPIQVSIAYEEKDRGWVSVGWWQLQRDACEELVSGSIQGRKIHAWATGRSNNGTQWWWGDAGEVGAET